MAKKPKGRRWAMCVVSNDHHANGSTGLLCPQGVETDDGLRILPSKAQRWTWECYLDFHRQAQALKKQYDPYLLYFINGDAFDGAYHHGTTQTVTGDPESQGYIVDEVFQPVLDLRPDQIHVVRGTVSHVGEAGASEEALAKHLGAVKDPDTDKYSSWHRRVELNGILIDVQHHGRRGVRPWTAQNALNALACQIWMEHTRKGERPPDLALRAHVHKFGDSYGAFPTRVLIPPSWQLKTSYAHAKATEELSDIGGIILLVSPEGEITVKPILYPVALPTPIKVTT